MWFRRRVLAVTELYRCHFYRFISKSGAKRFRKQGSSMYKNLYVRLSPVFTIFIHRYWFSHLPKCLRINENFYQQSNTAGEESIGSNCCINTNKSSYHYQSVSGFIISHGPYHIVHIIMILGLISFIGCSCNPV